jgi:hypothetical protein
MIYRKRIESLNRRINGGFFCFAICDGHCMNGYGRSE